MPRRDDTRRFSPSLLARGIERLNAVEIEEAVNRRRGEPDRASEIPLTNFRGIELRHFAVEVARLALIIAEYQCDELYRGQRLALAEFLPLNKDNWITHGNALRLDWLKMCPPTGTGGIRLTEDDLFQTPLDQTEIDFENEGGETYVCGNPPYVGSTWQSKEQKAEIRDVLRGRSKSPGFLDYIAGWFVKAADYSFKAKGLVAFVSTNSICQGQAVPILWPILFDLGIEIKFAHKSFQWANLASHNAGVTVAVIGFGLISNSIKTIWEDVDGETVKREGSEISPYLTLGKTTIVEKRRRPYAAIGVPEGWRWWRDS